MSSPPKPPPNQVQGKTLVLVVLGAILLAVGVVFWIGATGGSQHVPGGKPGVGFGDPNATATTGSVGDSKAWDGGAIEKTLHDRRVRDELRKRILAGWAQGQGEVAEAAREGRFLPAPVNPDGGDGMDPKYIQQVVRGDFLPMAEQCYTDFLSRKPDAAVMTMTMSFSIVADEKMGGLVEDVEVEQDGGTTDTEMQRCMHESFAGISFRPPAHGGTTTVVYPISFAPGDDDQ